MKMGFRMMLSCTAKLLLALLVLLFVLCIKHFPNRFLSSFLEILASYNSPDESSGTMYKGFQNLIHLFTCIRDHGWILTQFPKMKFNVCVTFTMRIVYSTFQKLVRNPCTHEHIVSVLFHYKSKMFGPFTGFKLIFQTM